MRLIFIYGLPGVGKLTVGKKLARLTKYKLFHNHLTVDLVGSVFEWGSKPFKSLREKIWLETFKLASKNTVPGLIFTFAFEKTVSKDFIDRVNNVLGKNDLIHFVELKCKMSELKKRVRNASRKQYGKIGSLEQLEQVLADDPSRFDKVCGKDVLRIDNTNLSPAKVAEKIIDAFYLA